MNLSERSYMIIVIQGKRVKEESVSMTRPPLSPPLHPHPFHCIKSHQLTRKNPMAMDV